MAEESGMSTDESENDLQAIAKISRQFKEASNKNDLILHGFEGIGAPKKNEHTVRKPRLKQRKRSAAHKSEPNQSTSSTTKRKNETSTNKPMEAYAVPAKKSKTTSANDGGGDSTLWKSRKNSKSKYLFDFFKALPNEPKSDDGKIDVFCTLCDKSTPPLSITVGNNSNLMKHLKTVCIFVVAVLTNLPNRIFIILLNFNFMKIADASQ